MAKASPALTSFAAGEMSPQMEGRIDVDKYPVGCHTLENFHCLVQGPAQRRAGTRFVAEVKASANKTWLRRFEFSNTQSFQIEFGDRYCRFYTNHGQVLSAGFPYEIVSPYAVADLTNSEGAFALQFEQSGDVLYIAGGGAGSGYAPYTLTRFSDTNWVFAQFSPTDGPFLEMNGANGVSSAGIALYASGTSGSVTIKAIGGNVFSATDVNRLVRLQVQSYNIKPWQSGVAVVLGDLRRFNGNTYKALNGATTGTAPPTNISGTQWDGAGNVLWQYQDSGYGIAKITAYTSATQVTATVLSTLPADVVGVVGTITAITQANPAVVSVVNAFAVGDPVFVDGVVGMTQLNDKTYTLSAVTGATATLSGIDSTAFTAYSSGGTITKNATVYWQLGAWAAPVAGNAYSGYWPRSVCFFSERLFWAGGLRWTASVPALYTSYTGDFQGQVTTDAAISGIISSQDVNTIVWMSAAQLLIIGTQGGEFGLGPITTTNPLGPDNVHVVRQSKQGCRSIRPELVGTSLLYVQRAGRRLLAMDYNFYIDRYDSTNQTRLASHITQSGVTGIAWQAQPFEIMWATRVDGTLIGYTFDREDNVTGYHRHPLGGSGIAESVSVTPAPDGTRDEVWLIVRRTINGVTRRYVEFIEKPYEPGDTQASCFYVDCGATYSGAPATTISGLGYLEGMTVSILKDGGVHPDKVVTGGAITLNQAGSVVNVGLRCSAKLVTMRIEAGADIGTSQGKTKRVALGTIRVVDTIGGKVGMENGQLDNIRENETTVGLSTPPLIYSGDTLIVWPGDYETDCRLQVQNDDPVPMTVVALFPNLQGSEPA